jgi:hypothetical protein
MVARGTNDGPQAPGFAGRTARADARSRNFLKNPSCELLDGIQSLDMGARSFFGERGEPEGDFGSLLCELIHQKISYGQPGQSKAMISPDTSGPYPIFG